MTREPNESLLQNRLTKSRNARVRSYLLIYTRFFLRRGRLKVLTFTVCRMEEEKYGARNEWGWKKVGIRDVGNDAKALIALSSVFRGSTTTIGTKEAGEGGEGFADGWSTWRLGSRRSFLSEPKHAYTWSRCKEKELRETNKTCSLHKFSFSFLIKIYYVRRIVRSNLILFPNKNTRRILLDKRIYYQRKINQSVSDMPV